MYLPLRHVNDTHSTRLSRTFLQPNFGVPRRRHHCHAIVDIYATPLFLTPRATYLLLTHASSHTTDSHHESLASHVLFLVRHRLTATPQPPPGQQQCVVPPPPSHQPDPLLAGEAERLHAVLGEWLAMQQPKNAKQAPFPPSIHVCSTKPDLLEEPPRKGKKTRGGGGRGKGGRLT